MEWFNYHYFKVNYFLKYFLISNTVNKQKLFGVLSNFWECKRLLRSKGVRTATLFTADYLPLPKYAQL